LGAQLRNNRSLCAGEPPGCHRAGRATAGQACSPLPRPAAQVQAFVACRAANPTDKAVGLSLHADELSLPPVPARPAPLAGASRLDEYFAGICWRSKERCAMWRWHMRVQTWTLAYLGTILLFATAYFLLPSGQFSQRLSLLDAFYFSVITITTTGFGDITARGTLAKICVSIEATAGITIVGLFLASLWREFTQRVEIVQEARLLKSHQMIGRATLFLYWRYVGSTVAEYRRRSAEHNPLTVSNHALHDWAEQCFENEDRLQDDLRYLLANEVIDEYTDARLAVFKTLSMLRASGVRTAVLGIDHVGPDAPAEVFAKHVHDTLEALEELDIAMDRLLSGSDDSAGGGDQWLAATGRSITRDDARESMASRG
jgi:hypothetical protein